VRPLERLHEIHDDQHRLDERDAQGRTALKLPMADAQLTTVNASSAISATKTITYAFRS